MRRAVLTSVLLVVLSAPAAASAQTVLDFEFCPTACPIGTEYVTQGVTFSPDDHLVYGGLANGDPGNWDLQGTNGSSFLGLNGSPSYAVTMAFTAPQTSIQMDVSRSAGSQEGDTLTVDLYVGAAVVGTTTIALQPINTWTTISLSAPGFDSVTITGNGAGFHPFGIDNVRLLAGERNIPTASTFGLGLMALAFAAAGATLIARRLA